MRFVSNEPKFDFSDVLIIPKTSTLESRSGVSLERTFKMKNAGVEWSGVPIISANMDTTGTTRMAASLSKYNMCTALHKHYSADENAAADNYQRVFYSLGTSDADFNKLKWLNYTPSMVCLDVANGYTTKFIDRVSELREIVHPETIIMAGNVVTPEKTEQILLAGADIVKVGIGGGSVCTTRVKAGVGYPQLSAVIECADAAHGLNGLICSDGGCTVPGDVVKAFAGGADFVMLGGMLAGTDECDGQLIYTESSDGKGYPSHMKFYGMSSKAANEKYNGGLGTYKAAEGKEVLVPYKGPVSEVVEDILGGLRSALTYTGSSKLSELTKRSSFVIVNNQHNRVFGD
jgi:GMP reductase